MTAYALLLLSVLSADAKAIISGPDIAQAGDLVVLDGSKSVGSHLVWVPVTEFKGWASVENGKRCFLSARRPGKYTLMLIAVDAKTETVSHDTHTITLTDTLPDPNPPVPPPDPIPPTPPGPNPKPDLTTLSGRVESWVYDLQIPVVDRQKESLALSQAFAEVASMIAAGVIKQPAEIPPKISAAITKALGSRAMAWEPWADKLIDELDAQDTAGRLTTLANYQSALEAIAKGLSRAGGVQAKSQPSQRKRAA